MNLFSKVGFVDIEVFQTSMLPSLLEEYTYVDLKSNQVSRFTRDCNSIKEMSVLGVAVGVLKRA